MNKKYYCVDCGKELKNRYAKRCKSCEYNRRKIAYKGKNNFNFKFKITKTFLEKNYLQRKKSMCFIAKIVGCSIDTIKRNLIKYNIMRRRFGEGKKGKKLKKYNRRSYKAKNNPFYGQHHTKKTKKKLSDKNKNYKHTKEAKRKISLGHGGTGIPYANNKYPEEFYKIRDFIRKRDNYKCQICGMTEEKHITIYGKVLEVHHIDYDKKINEETNLITLCKQCNLRANKNRDYWKEYFKEK